MIHARAPSGADENSPVRSPRRNAPRSKCRVSSSFNQSPALAGRLIGNLTSRFCSFKLIWKMATIEYAHSLPIAGGYGDLSPSQRTLRVEISDLLFRKTPLP